MILRIIDRTGIATDESLMNTVIGEAHRDMRNLADLLDPEEKKGEINMKDSRYYFLLGFMTAILVAMMISCTISPLEASASEIGSTPYNPLYVKVVD